MSPSSPSEQPTKERSLWLFLDLWNILLILVGVGLVFLVGGWLR